MDNKKAYKITGRYTAVRNRTDRAEYFKAAKKLVGVALIVVAAVFGGLLSKLSTGAAFATVFAYISTQAAIWLK